MLLRLLPLRGMSRFIYIDAEKTTLSNLEKKNCTNSKNKLFKKFLSMLI